jgi:putative Mg2+ transporter-C (MgtC) family protein
MNVLQHELLGPFTDYEQVIRVAVRLLVALVLGGLVGLEREHEGKAAGIRTYMMVCLGATLFTLVGSEGRMSSADISRIIQGVAAGLGFLGAGTIVKSSDEHRIQGLTTAAAVWATAAAGCAIGLGLLWEALAGVILAWIILLLVGKLEHWLKLKGW